MVLLRQMRLPHNSIKRCILQTSNNYNSRKKVEHNFSMNKNKSFERKITLQTSDQSDSNPRAEVKSPNNRISSIKCLSFKDIPFSQHIFYQEPTSELKVSSATNFNPERWNFEPRWDILGKEFEDKSRQIREKNRFFEARIACLNKSKERKPLQKRQSVFEEIDHGLIDDVITFRTIKKNANQRQPKKAVQTLI